MNELPPEIRFTDALKAWNTGAFAATLRQEILSLGPAGLGLHRLASQTGCVDDAEMEAAVLGYAAEGNNLRAEVGVHFTEILAGCSCGEEPQASHAYCQISVYIHRSTGAARFEVRQ